MIMNWNRLDWSRLHVHVPDFQGQVITRKDVPSIVAEFHVRNRRDDFREERARRWIFLLLKAYIAISNRDTEKDLGCTLCMPIA